jgi:hypothetical protein
MKRVVLLLFVSAIMAAAQPKALFYMVDRPNSVKSFSEDVDKSIFSCLLGTVLTAMDSFGADQTHTFFRRCGTAPCTGHADCRHDSTS